MITPSTEKRPLEEENGTPKSKKQRTLMDFFGKKKSTVETGRDAKLENTSEHANSSEGALLDAGDKPLTHKPKVTPGDAKLKFRETLKPEQLALLSLELDTIDDTWFYQLTGEFVKPYFLQLKQFVLSQQKQSTVFPPPPEIYSWSRLTPFDKVRVVIIGQDPYHNFNQAHGLAFSVKPPTSAPPSLQNIYKELKTSNYPDFQIDNKVGDLSPWSEQGVLLLNTCLTVKAHSANSHSKKGWEQFTKRVVELLIKDRKRSGEPLVFLLWGNNARKLVEGLLGSKPENFLVLKSVHPSPLSASRGFFGNRHFKQINDWLYAKGEHMIDWSVAKGATLDEVQEKNLLLDA